MPSAGARRAALGAAAHLERSATWNGLQAGDPVVVGGLSLRGATWEFRAHVRNTNNGTESIEVVGGKPGDRSIRSFEPDRIFPVSAKSRGRSRSGGGIEIPSLAEAPQLLLLSGDPVPPKVRRRSS